VADGGRVLDDLAAFGPFFAVDSHPPGEPPRPPWRPLRDLAERPGSLLDRIASVRAALAAAGECLPEEIDLKVAASAAHLGLVARLVAPALGAAALGERVSFPLGELWWQDKLGGPVPLSVPAPRPASPASCIPAAADGTGALGGWAERLLAGLVAPVTIATSRLAAVSGQVLWGNAASGINAAARQAATARPDLADAAWEAARALFSSPWLSRERQPPGVAFRRSSCCLLYRLAPGARAASSAICGDCVLGLISPRQASP
jgi:hypothetical protein